MQFRKKRQKKKIILHKISFLMTMVSKFLCPLVIVFKTNKDFQNFLINFDILKKIKIFLTNFQIFSND